MSEITSIVNLEACAVFKWRITDFCNYDCSYCIHTTHQRTQEPEKDKERCQTSIQYVRRICEEMSANTGKKIKMQPIGGEVTVFPWFIDFVKELTADAPWFECVNLTSNFSRPNDWWRELSKSSSAPITATVSYHPEGYKDGMEDFVSRLAELQKEGVFGHVKAETVYNEEFQHAEEFSKLCKEKGVICVVDLDLRKEWDGESNPHKYTHRKKRNRYRVSFDDGTTTEFQSRNEFLKLYSVKDGRFIDCNGFNCSMLYDYIYCDRDTIAGCHPIFPKDGNGYCNSCHVKDFHPLKTISPCPKSERVYHYCSICGNMSLYKDGHIPENLKLEKPQPVELS